MENNKKKKNEKILIIGLSVPALLFVCYMMYSTFAGSKNNNTSEQDTTKNSSAIILPDVKDDTIEKNKSSIYDELDNVEEQQKRQNAQMQEEDFYSMGENKQQQNSSTILTQQPQKNTSQSQLGTKKKKKSTIISQTNQNSSIPSNQSTAIVNNNDNSYNFGVYKAKPSALSTNSTNTNNDYIPAILEKSQKIKNGSEIIFILQKAITINGVFYDKMSIMYGMAKFTGTRVDIIINTIQDKKGIKHPVILTGYNENYQQGIYYSDKIENTTNKTGTKILSQAASTALGGGNAGQLASSSTSALMTRENGEINVAGGYKMFFK